MLTVIPDPSGCDDVAAGGLSAGASLIDEIVWEGAWRMLAQALQAEVDAYIAHSPTSGMNVTTAWWSATDITSRGRCSPARGRSRCARRGSTTSASTR